jgi:cytochrome o ubiquinol oxidase subunit 2
MYKKYKIVLLVLGLAGLTAGLWLRGMDIPVLQPRGTIADKQRNLMFLALLLSCIVVIPVFALTIGISWKYREGNKKAKYSPELDHSRLLETIWWLVPLALILILSVVTYRSSHDLDPYKPISSSKKPLTIQVVALDWKWLFIYPEQHIASVNYVRFPAGTPLNFQMTAEAPMNSFWIPQLGGQMYVMSGMTTHLHLMANHPGTFNGSSANISGKGFAGMRFTAQATTDADFAQWARLAQQSPKHLTLEEYAQLSKPSENNPRTLYTAPIDGLYDTIELKYMVPPAANKATAGAGETGAPRVDAF